MKKEKSLSNASKVDSPLIKLLQTIRASIFILFTFFFCAIATVYAESDAQQAKKEISGTVTDENGLAVIGANVIEVGTTIGTVTDVDGNFRLRVEENSVIRVSYIGYLD